MYNLCLCFTHRTTRQPWPPFIQSAVRIRRSYILDRGSNRRHESVSLPDENSPLTPLLPLEHHQRTGDARFGFSPLTVNRLLAQGTTPTVLKSTAAYYLCPSTAATDGAAAAAAVDQQHQTSGGAIRKRYSVPNNSPMPQPPPPDIVLATALSGHIISRPVRRPHRRSDHEPDVNNNCSSGAGTSCNQIALHRAAAPTIDGNAQQQAPPKTIADQNTPRSSHDARRPTATPSAPASQLDSALVVNILEDNRLGHLGAIFRREEIDLDVFCMMDRADLVQIGVANEDCERVLHIVRSLNKL